MIHKRTPEELTAYNAERQREADHRAQVLRDSELVEIQLEGVRFHTTRAEAESLREQARNARKARAARRPGRAEGGRVSSGRLNLHCCRVISARRPCAA